MKTKPSKGLTVEKIREFRHEILHEPDGVVYVFKDRLELSPYSKQPPCDVCGEPRGSRR